ncbi:MAG: hypothetical protein ACXACY_25565 [Candidatus Hodarchaeales archaeon]|jgi:hypothetical protein
MSGLIEGDAVKNFGEFIPNPYLEKITVTNHSPTEVELEIEYSLLFHIGDLFDSDDIVKILDSSNLNIYGLFEYKIDETYITKYQLAKFIYNGDADIQNSQPIVLDKSNYKHTMLNFMDADTLRNAIEGTSTGTPIDFDTEELEIYDSEDRRVIKYYLYKTVIIDTTGLDDYYNFYLFATTLSNDNISDPQAAGIHPELIVKNMSDVTFEPIFSPDLQIRTYEENVYLDASGTKYPFTPLLSTDRNYYKTSTVTREMVVDKTQTLVNRFNNGSDSVLTDMVTSIEYVLETEEYTENLIVELDKVRRAFPNKTNNNPVGNLYALLTQLLININSAFPATDKLEKQRYLTSKVLDLRTSSENILTITRTATDYYGVRPLITRTAISSGNVTNSGIFLVRFQDMVKDKSDFFSVVDYNRFINICDTYGLHGLKRAIYSKYQFLDFYFQDQSGAKNKTNMVLPVEVSYEISEMEEYNFSFTDPNNLMRSYTFQHDDVFSNEEKATFHYEIIAEVEDKTSAILLYYKDLFDKHFAYLKEYKEQANEYFSYNEYARKFNNFFSEGVTEYWDDIGVYPWDKFPQIYGMLLFLMTDTFENLQDLNLYIKRISYFLSPNTGDLEELNSIVASIEDFRLEPSGIYAALNQFNTFGYTSPRTNETLFEGEIELTTVDFQEIEVDLYDPNSDYESITITVGEFDSLSVSTSTGIGRDKTTDTSKNYADVWKCEATSSSTTSGLFGRTTTIYTTSCGTDIQLSNISMRRIKTLRWTSIDNSVDAPKSVRNPTFTNSSQTAGYYENLDGTRLYEFDLDEGEFLIYEIGHWQIDYYDLSSDSGLGAPSELSFPT